MAKLIVRKNSKGRGVYAGQRFRRGDIIEVCHVILLHASDGEGIIGKYWWEWQGRFKAALPLGHISLCNHSPTPNAGIVRLYKRNRMVMRALRTIDKGEEILIFYGEDFVDFRVLP